MIELQQSTQPLSALDLSLTALLLLGRRDKKVVTDALMIPFKMVMGGVYSLNTWRSDLSLKRIILARHSDLMDKTNRSAYAFRLGERGGNFTGSIFTDRSSASK